MWESDRGAQLVARAAAPDTRAPDAKRDAHPRFQSLEAYSLSVMAAELAKLSQLYTKKPLPLVDLDAELERDTSEIGGGGREAYLTNLTQLRAHRVSGLTAASRRSVFESEQRRAVRVTVNVAIDVTVGVKVGATADVTVCSVFESEERRAVGAAELEFAVLPLHLPRVSWLM